MVNRNFLDGVPEVSVILPCRDEEEAVGGCIQLIKKVFRENNIIGEIIVSDSSSDSSPNISRRLGARVVKHDKEGYGIACMEGLKAARGKYLFLADADGSYDFAEIPRFVDALRQGADMVVGDRFAGKMEKGAMPLTHKWIGNPALSFLLRLFFSAKVKDVHCGMRAITKGAWKKLSLHTTGMEFASEMIVQAVKKKLTIAELPIVYHRRCGRSKLKTLSDGWRHLRFLLLYSPLYLFLLPGIGLFLLGLVSMLILYLGGGRVVGVELFYHPMFLSSMLIIVGYQLIFFGFFAKTYSMIYLEEKSSSMAFFLRHITLEKALMSGLAMAGISAIMYLSIFIQWLQSGFGELQEVKNAIIALTLVVLGVQTFFSGFMLSVLGIKRH